MRLIDADALTKAHCEGCAKDIQEVCKTDPVCASMMWVVKATTVDAVEVVKFNALQSLIKGEWVECKLVQEALGIDFATGLKMFDFSRTAEWNPAPLNGQKITTKFKLKNAVKHGRWEPVDHDGSWRVDMCSICHRRMHYVDYDQPYQYCPNCGAKLSLPGFVKACVDFLIEKTVIPTNEIEKMVKETTASGDSSKLAASGYSSKLAASGDYSKLAASGYSSKLAASGKHSVVAGVGIGNKAKAIKGCWITLAEWTWSDEENTYIPVCVKTEFVDGERIKEDVFYELKNGAFVEADD